MDTLMYLFAAAVLAVSGLVTLTVWSHRAVAAKVGGLALGAIVMGIAYTGFAELMGRAKPERLDWLRTAADGQLVGSRIDEGKAIFLWIQFAEPAEPLAFKLPWSLPAAKELQGAARAGAETGTAVRVRLRSRDDSDPTEPMFYAEPQPPLPPKKEELGALHAPH